MNLRVRIVTGASAYERIERDPESVSFGILQPAAQDHHPSPRDCIQPSMTQKSTSFVLQGTVKGSRCKLPTHHVFGLA